MPPEVMEDRRAPTGTGLAAAAGTSAGGSTEQRFREQFDAFAALAVAGTGGGARLPLRWDDRKPCLDDAGPAHAFDRHYVYHTAWAARVLAETMPARHVDVGSSLFFAGIASAFVPVDFYDFRRPAIDLPNLAAGTADLTRLPWPDRSVPSLSCMHVIEHVGLGRYGDPLDPDGDLAALRELQRVLAPGGSLLVVVPVGRPRIVFNAHRVYAKRHITAALPELVPHRFDLIADGRIGGGLIADPPDALVAEQHYGCGCFWFRRPS